MRGQVVNYVHDVYMNKERREKSRLRVQTALDKQNFILLFDIVHVHTVRVSMRPKSNIKRETIRWLSMSLGPSTL